MNAEKLLEIATLIQQEFQQLDTHNRLNRVISHLTNSINQPNNANHQSSLATERIELSSTLKASPSNSFSAGIRQVLDETGLSPVLGDQLRDRIEQIFMRNAITPAAAREELNAISSELAEKVSAVSSLTAGMNHLRISRDTLVPGECEIGVLVPRLFVKNDLASFGKELQELTKILGPFEELATGSRAGFQIRAISSSDLSVFLQSVPAVAACLAVALERIINIYKGILEIRALRNQLLDKGLDEKSVKGVEDHVNKMMDDSIEPLVSELVQRFAPNLEKGRKNELQISLRTSAKKLANRIDRGFNLEIRAIPAPTDATNEDSVRDSDSGFADEVIKRAPTLTYIRTQGEPILKLTAEDTDSTSSDTKTPKK